LKDETGRSSDLITPFPRMRFPKKWQDASAVKAISARK
jgi:hypothetical protein